MWGTFLSNYKYFSCQSSCLLLLLEVCKNHYRKENLSIGGIEQRRDAIFWIHLRETRLKVFILLQVYLSFPTFIFSTNIKLFICHPVVLFGIRAVQWLCAASPMVILKDRQLCLQKYWVLYPIIAFVNKNNRRIRKFSLQSDFTLDLALF